MLCFHTALRQIKEVPAMRLLAMILFASCFLSASAQEETERLLGASVTKRITFTWQQDGRVVEILLQNPKDTWVLRQLEFQARFPEESDPRKKSQTELPKSYMSALTEYLHKQEQLETHSVRVEVQPGQSAAIHFEMKTVRTIVDLARIFHRER